MKKYVKPELFYERYELTEQIANCAWELNQAQGTCGFTPDPVTGNDPSWVIIDGTTKGCAMDMSPSEGQLYCYMNGAEGMSTFDS